MPLPPTPPTPPRTPSRDPWSQRLQQWRASRRAAGHRRAALLAAGRAAAEGQWVAGVGRDGDHPVAVDGELRLFDGTTVALGTCHRPTLERLAGAIGAGPVVVELVADHGTCWGTYLRTVEGSVGVLSPRLAVGGGRGQARRPSPAVAV